MLMLKLTGLTLEGFMSFSADFPGGNLPGMPGRGRVTNRLSLGDVTVLIGPNGAGKSVIVSFFKMLSAMMAGKFQEYVARAGYANSLLHYGAKRTPEIRILIEFEDKALDVTGEYSFQLVIGANDRLVLTEEPPKCHGKAIEELKEHRLEELRKWRIPLAVMQADKPTAAKHEESRLSNTLFNDWVADGIGGPKDVDVESQLVASTLLGCQCYYFADSTSSAKIRQHSYIEDNSRLQPDGNNLAAFLYGLKSREDTAPYFRRIENTIQLAFPQLDRFVLEPRFTNERYVQLNWISRADDGYLMGPHQLSDGALRFSALAALLLQPPDMLPSFIILDEPELGLHPGAIELLAEMIKGVALQKQVLVATQSPQLVNYFDLSQIRPIEHWRGHSVILELDPEAYKDWLDEYSTGELWEKNIIGGGPTGA